MGGFKFRKAMRAWLKRGIPDRIRFKIYRKLLRLPYQLPEGFVVKVAETRQELEQAFSLVHDSYVEVGFMEEDKKRMRVAIYHALPTTTVVVAKIHDQVVGTFTVITQNPLGLPSDIDFETDFLKQHGARVAEISALAIQRNYRANGGMILFPMIKYMHDYCRYFLGVDILQIATSPIRRDFYEGLLEFRPISDTIVEDPIVSGAKMCALYIDLRGVKKSYADLYAGHSKASNLYHFLFEHRCDNLIFPKRDLFVAYDPCLDQEAFKYFMLDVADLSRRATEKQKSILRHIYLYNCGFHQLAPHLRSSYAWIREARAFRHPMNCNIFVRDLNDQPLFFSVAYDVSKGGLKFFAKANLVIGQKLKFTIYYSVGRSTMEVGEVVWTDNQGIFGVQIIQPSAEWNGLTSYLQARLSRHMGQWQGDDVFERPRKAQ